MGAVGHDDPAELAVCAARALLRGGSWPALAQELVWSALRACGGGGEAVWLVPLVEAQLAETADRLEAEVAATVAEARREHLRSWPDDVVGATIVGDLDGHEHALRLLSERYYQVLEWAIGVLQERARPRQQRRWGGLRRRRREPAGQPVECEIPWLVANELTRSRERFGWRRRAA